MNRTTGLALLLLIASVMRAEAQDDHPAVDQPITAKDIVAGIVSATKQVTSLSVKTEVKESLELVRVGNGMGNQRTTFFESWHVDSNRRGWARSIGQTIAKAADNPGYELAFEQTAVFDGRRGESFRLEQRSGGKPNEVAKVEKHLVGRGDSPFRFAMLHPVELSATLQRTNLGAGW